MSTKQKKVATARKPRTERREHVYRIENVDAIINPTGGPEFTGEVKRADLVAAGVDVEYLVRSGKLVDNGVRIYGN